MDDHPIIYTLVGAGIALLIIYLSKLLNQRRETSRTIPHTITRFVNVHLLNGGWDEEQRSHANAEQRSWRYTAVYSLLSLLLTLSAAVAAFLAYNQTKRQADIAEIVEHTQLRAYVGMTLGDYHLGCQNCKPLPNDEVNGLYIISTMVKNYGQTPALRPHTCGLPLEVTHDGVVNREDVQLIEQLCSRSPSIQNQITIWPQTSAPVEMRYAPNDMVARVRNGTSRTFVLGFTTYDDIFSEHHTSWFCAQYRRDDGYDLFNGCDREFIPADF